MSLNFHVLPMHATAPPFASHLAPTGQGQVVQSPVQGRHAIAPSAPHLAASGQGQVLQSPVHGIHANIPPFASH